MKAFWVGNDITPPRLSAHAGLDFRGFMLWFKALRIYPDAG
jgi:hypothetical protein